MLTNIQIYAEKKAATQVISRTDWISNVRLSKWKFWVKGKLQVLPQQPGLFFMFLVARYSKLQWNCFAARAILLTFLWKQKLHNAMVVTLAAGWLSLILFFSLYYWQITWVCSLNRMVNHLSHDALNIHSQFTDYLLSQFFFLLFFFNHFYYFLDLRLFQFCLQPKFFLHFVCYYLCFFLFLCEIFTSVLVQDTETGIIKLTDNFVIMKKNFCVWCLLIYGKLL